MEYQSNPSQGTNPPPIRYSSLRFIIFMTLTYNLSSFYFGYSMVYFNAVPYSNIETILGLKPQLWGIPAEGIMTGCISFGALFGSGLSKKIFQRSSRRNCFLFGNCLALFAGFISLIENWYFLLISRILQGFCVGFYSALTPLMVKEMSPTEISGALGALISPSIAFGFLTAYSLPYILSNVCGIPLETYWRMSFNLTMLTSLLQLILIRKYFPFDSPKYLILQGKMEKMREVIQVIYKPEYWSQIEKQKIKDLMELPQEGANNIPEEPIHEDFQEDELAMQQQEGIQHETENQKQHLSRQKKQLPHNNPLAVFYAISLPFFQQLSGINIIVTFASQVVSKRLPSLQQQIPLFINSEKLVFAMIVVFVLQKFGRKPIMLIGTFFVMISLFILFVGLNNSAQEKVSHQNLILLGFFLYIPAFVLSMGPITWLYMPEIIQPNILPYGVMTHWAMACLIVTLFPIIRNHSKNPGCPQLFLFFAISTLLFLIVSYCLMVETKNKKEYTIRQQYEVKWQQIRKVFM